jgi:uncharacterized protein YbjT (DUF2867 family)
MGLDYHWSRTAQTLAPEPATSVNAMRVAVIGATGYVGGRLVPQLLAAGHEVRCLARTPARLDRVPWRDDVEVLTADVTDLASLEAAFVGIDAAYYLVHAMGQARDFETRDRIGAENTAAAAARCGLSRLIYLGGLGRDDGGEPLTWPAVTPWDGRWRQVRYR